jgi:hypothetical protein
MPSFFAAAVTLPLVGERLHDQFATPRTPSVPKISFCLVTA